MAKAKYDRTGQHVLIFCPGCRRHHVLNVTVGSRPCWQFNGDLDKPTFTPSLLERSGHHVTGQPQPPHCWLCNNADAGEKYNYACGVCHSFIHDGKIEFLDDSTHALAGQVVDLPDVDQRGED